MIQKWNLRQNAVYRIVWYQLHWPPKIFIQDKKGSCSGPCITAVSPAALMMGCAFPLGCREITNSTCVLWCYIPVQDPWEQKLPNYMTSQNEEKCEATSEVRVIKASKMPQEVLGCAWRKWWQEQLRCLSFHSHEPGVLSNSQCALLSKDLCHLHFLLICHWKLFLFCS